MSIPFREKLCDLIFKHGDSSIPGVAGDAEGTMRFTGPVSPAAVPAQKETNLATFFALMRGNALPEQDEKNSRPGTAAPAPE